MSTDVRQCLRDYLAAGLRMDLPYFQATYAPGFTIVRADLAGRVLTITRDQLLAELGRRAADGLTMPPADDVEVLTTAAFGPHEAIVFRRVKQGQPLVYTFVWDLSGPRPLLVQEITTQQDLPWA